jgi:hypothetical protein
MMAPSSWRKRIEGPPISSQERPIPIKKQTIVKMAIVSMRLVSRGYMMSWSPYTNWTLKVATSPTRNKDAEAEANYRVDSARAVRETRSVVRPGAAQQNLARTLNAAYARGLLSENTLSHRLDLLFGTGLVDGAELVGDLMLRTGRRPWRSRVLDLVATAARAIRRPPASIPREPSRLLSLDWNGGEQEVIVGRDPSCDLVLTLPSVSRRHARLAFRDGSWVIQDLESRNGTVVNGVAVGRCELRPGDYLVLGDEHLVVD